VIAKLRRRGIQIYRRGIQIYRCRATLQGTCRARASSSPSDVTPRVGGASLCGAPTRLRLLRARQYARAQRRAARSSSSRRGSATARAQSSAVAQVGGHSGCFRGMRELFVAPLGNVPSGQRAAASKRSHMAQTTAMLVIEVLYARHSLRIGRGSCRKRPAD